MALEDLKTIAEMDQRHSLVQVTRRSFRAHDWFAMGSPASAG